MGTLVLLGFIRLRVTWRVMGILTMISGIVGVSAWLLGAMRMPTRSPYAR